MNALWLPVLVTCQLAAATADKPVSRIRNGGVAAILAQPDLPERGKLSSPQAVAKIFERAGLKTQLLSAEQLADPTVLSASRFDLLVVPTGASFPAEARLATIDFLQKGGSLITTGGYAFGHLVRNVGGRWLGEEELLKRRLQDAFEKQSLIADGGFEKVRVLPLGGSATDGQWRRGSDRCTVVEEEPKQGRFAAKVDLPEGMPDPGAQFWLDLPATSGKTYQVSGWMRTRNVTGTGIAFIAIYQHDATGKLVEHRDFASVRGTTPWRLYTYVFTPKPQVARLHVFFGFYLAHGTAWFDEIRLVETTGLDFRPMNTATGKPGDGLAVAPTQIGMFDPSYPLKRAGGMRTAADQHVLREPVEYRGEVSGWAASGLVGDDNARWVPLLEAFDRYGRTRGAAGAMLLHYNGPFAGSFWAFFGAENVDLWSDPAAPAARGLQQIARFMLRKTFLHNLTSDHRLYRDGEAVHAAVIVDNRGCWEFRGKVRFELRAPGAAAPLAAVVRDAAVGPAANLRIEAAFPVAGTLRVPALPHTERAVHMKLDQTPPLARLAATLECDGQPIDTMLSGVVFEQPAVLRSGPPLRFRDNYFQLNGRPMFLFGTDEYALTYKAACENPWTWQQELGAARDLGMNLYENLQYQNPGHRMEEDDWRAFQAMAQLTQQTGLVFMPGMLIGHNVAIGDAALAEESRLCRQYAQRLGSTPGLLWYINGDYQLDPRQHPDEVKTLWNRWLKAEHSDTGRLRSVWGPAAVQGELGSLPYPPPNSGRWDDAAAVDQSRFLNWLMRRWNQAHVAAVRGPDPEHPITSEYYCFPFGGIDMLFSIDGQDVANTGYFDEPGVDVEKLPLRLRWNDLRLRGKGASLGEYGVKTHPAWTAANGAQGYHIARSEEEQKRLFLAVGHYALGLGASKVQNWCLRDDPTWVFPWGIFYPQPLVPKDVAYVHRNQSIVWRFFRPVYRPGALAVCIANQLRLGNDDSLGTTVAYRAFADLLALHFEFNVIDDDHLAQLPRETRVMILPCPLAMRDEAFERLLAWVRAGGALFLTGDFTHNEYRQRTRTNRLKQLAGVEFVAANCPAGARAAAKEARVEFPGLGIGLLSLRPSIRIKPLAQDFRGLEDFGSLQIIGRTADGEAVLVRHSVGEGVVYFLTDPIEMADDNPPLLDRRQLYAAFLRGRLGPQSVSPDEPWLHVMSQPTVHGMVHVIYNTKAEAGVTTVELHTAAGRVQLQTRNGWPALAAVTEKGKVVAINAYGRASAGHEPVMEGTGLKALLSLDGDDLRAAKAVLIAPFESGRVQLPNGDGSNVALVGEFRDGAWATLERIPLEGAKRRLEIDAERATCLILVCPRAEEAKWTGRLTQAMLRPDQIVEY